MARRASPPRGWRAVPEDAQERLGFRGTAHNGKRPSYHQGAVGKSGVHPGKRSFDAARLGGLAWGSRRVGSVFFTANIGLSPRVVSCASSRAWFCAFSQQALNSSALLPEMDFGIDQSRRNLDGVGRYCSSGFGDFLLD